MLHFCPLNSKMLGLKECTHEHTVAEMCFGRLLKRKRA